MPSYRFDNYRISHTPFYLQITNESNQTYYYRLPILEGEHIELVDLDENTFMLQTATHRIYAGIRDGDENQQDIIQIDLYRLNGDDIPLTLAVDLNANVRVLRALRAIGAGEPVMDADPEPPAPQNEENGAPNVVEQVNGDPENIPGDLIAAAGGRRRKNTRGKRRRQIKRKSRKQRRN